MVEIPKAICEIGIGEPDFDGSAMLKTVISDQEGFANRNERSANVVLDIESLDVFTDKKKDLSSSPKSTRSLSRKGSYRAEKKIYEREVDETSKQASTKGWGLNILPDKCVVVPVRREVSSSGEGSMRWRRYFNKRNLWADPRRILFIFATLGNQVDRSTCWLYNRNLENVDHLFFQCGYSKWIWLKLISKFRLGNCTNSLVEEARRLRTRFVYNPQLRNIAVLVLTTTIWHIWKGRNMRKFKGIKRHKVSKFNDICRDIDWKSQSISANGGPEPDNFGLNGHNLDMSILRAKARQVYVPKSCSWNPPVQGVIKLNTDGSLSIRVQVLAAYSEITREPP